MSTEFNMEAYVDALEERLIRLDAELRADVQYLEQRIISLQRQLDTIRNQRSREDFERSRGIRR